MFEEKVDVFVKPYHFYNGSKVDKLSESLQRLKLLIVVKSWIGFPNFILLNISNFYIGV